MKFDKYYIFPLLLILLSLSYCQNSPQGIEDTIVQLENKIGPPYTAEGVNQLIKAYQDYVSTYPDRDDQNAVFLRKGAMIAIEAGQFNKAAELLTLAIKDHFEADNTKDNVLLLGKVYRDHIKNKNVAATVFQAGQQQYPQEEAFSKQIDPNWVTVSALLDQLKAGVVDSIQKQINYAFVNDYIISCEAYAMILPQDSLSPDLIFQAGQLAHQTQTYNKALELLDWLYLQYPDHPMAADALFLNAYILDSELKRFDEAEQRYEAFLERYPDNEFAETAQFLLDNLGVPAEEIIKGFEEQQ